MGIAGLLAVSAALAAAPAQMAYPNLPGIYDSNTLIVLPTPTAPVLDGTIDAAWDAAPSLEVVAFGASGNWVPGNGIRVRALHNATAVFMLIEWADTGADRSLDAWRLTDNTTAGGVWNRTLWGDDGLLLFFDNGSGLEQNFSVQGCAGLCHTGAVQEMRTDQGFIDVWKWSASRTDPFGYAEDLYIDNASQLTGSPTGGFHPDSADTNVNNTVVTGFGDRPAFVNSSVPAATSPTFVYDSAKTALNWATFNSTTLPTGTTVAGSVIAAPTGGRGDVKTGASHNATAWTVELSRPFVTGDNASRDMGIGDLNVPYFFGLAVLNNKTGVNHSTSGVAYKMLFAENAMPDLAVRAVIPAASPVLIGDPVNLTAVVHNFGFGDAGGPVFVAVDDDLTTLEVANATTAAVPWNQEHFVSLSFSSIGFLPGAHAFTALVDTADTEAESFEGNNTFAFSITFVSTLSPPNLVIDAAAGPAGAVFASDPFYINGTVSNQGPGDSVLNVTVRGFHPAFGNQTADLGPLMANQSANFSLLWDSTGIARGFYNFDVTVDPNNLIVETDENNTLPVQVRVDDRPDLLPPSIDADPASGFGGDTIFLNLTVKNTGAPTAGPVAVWIYLDDGTSTTPLNRSAVWNLTVNLAHGANQTFSFTWDLPTTLTIGPHLIRAWVDAEGAVDEVSETNNNASVQIAVRAPPLPDLSPVAGSLDKAVYRIGENGTATVTVANVGVDYTGDITLRVVDATGNRTLVAATFGPIAGGSQASFTFNFTLTASTLGNHIVIVLVDPEGALDEATEVNNSFGLNFTLLAAPSPDLSVVRVTTNPASPTRGDIVHVEAEVRNGGSAAVGVTKVEFFHGTTSLGEVDVPALDPGESVLVGLDWNTSAVTGLSALVAAEADARHTVVEPDENNNRLQVTVTFQRPGAPSISMTGLSFEPTSTAPGGRVNITVTVRNNGTAGGDGMVAVRVDGAEIAVFNFTLAAGEERSLIARWNATTGGSHPIRAELSLSGAVIEQRQATADVVFATPTAPPNYGIVLVVAAILVFLALVLFLRRPREPVEAAPHSTPKGSPQEPPKDSSDGHADTESHES